MLLFYQRAVVELSGNGREVAVFWPSPHTHIRTSGRGAWALNLHRLSSSFSYTKKFKISRQKDSGILRPATEAW